MSDLFIPIGATFAPAGRSTSVSRKNEPLSALVDRDLESAIKTVSHPAQVDTVNAVERLLLRLDACVEPVELYEFQVDLFRAMHSAQEAQAAASRALKRVAAARPPDFAVEWPVACDAGSLTPEDWELERRVAERAVRQLRTVGDALAWRIYGYDRRAIIALSQNSPPGPFVGKEGLGYELGAVQDRLRDRGHFALLHDLTNVLRIGDLTECHANGYLEIDEIKATDSSGARAARRQQARRAQNAIDSIAGKKPLIAPPSSSDDHRQHLWTSSVTFRSEVHQLAKVAQAASARQGWAVASLGQGRVLAFMDLVLAASRADAEATVKSYNARRGQLLDRVGWDRVHLLKARTADTASRHPYLAPISIFPIPADLRARLICDQAVAEMHIPVERVADALERADCRVETLLRHDNSELDDGHDVLAAWRGTRRLLVHGPCMGQLLLELVDLSRWGKACREMLDTDAAAEHPVLLFSDEDRYWTRSEVR